jgi:hypothetical protein
MACRFSGVDVSSQNRDQAMMLLVDKPSIAVMHRLLAVLAFSRRVFGNIGIASCCANEKTVEHVQFEMMECPGWAGRGEGEY